MTTRALDPLRLDDGRYLTLCEVGDPGGEVAFYFHGTGSSRLEVALYAQSAAKHGRRLVAWDRPGSGHSTDQPGRTLLDVAADARAVAASLGVERVAVIGLSGGGTHVVALAATAPELVRVGVAINPGAPADPDMRAELSPTIARFMSLARNRPAMFKVAARVMEYQGGPRVQKLKARALDPMDAEVLARPDVKPLFEASAAEGAHQPHAYTKEALIIWGRPWGFSVDALAVPLHVFAGSEDVFLPFGRRLERAGAELHVFPGGHVSGFVPEVMDEVMAVAARRG